MEIDTLRPRNTLYNLRQRWFALAALSLTFLFITTHLLSGSFDPFTTIRWLALSLGITLLLLFTLWRNLSFNHRQHESHLLPTLGAGNTITFLRGLLVAVMAGFILVPPADDRSAVLPAIFYTLANLGDFFDGYLARRQEHVTRLGEVLDMFVDSLGVLSASLLLVHYGKVPLWFLLVGLARYLFLAGIWLRRRMNLPVHTLPPSDIRRALAAVQMNFIVILLWPLFSPPATIFAAAAFAIPFLLNFLRDWLVVSGVVSPRPSLQNGLRRFILNGLPLFLRLALFVMTTVSALAHLVDSDAPLELDALLRLSSQDIPSIIPLLLVLVLPFMLLLGIAGRSAALTGLILLGINQNFSFLTSAQLLWVILFAAIFHLGTGPLSLWKPEDSLITLRAGRRPRHLPSPVATAARPVAINNKPSLPEVP